MTRDRRHGTWMVVGAALFLLGAALSVDPSRLRRGPPLDGETGQVLAAMSLARDHDLRYDREDLEDATALFGSVPSELELARTGSGELRYVASGLEPWLVSWLVPWLGSRAFTVFHCSVLMAAALLAWWRVGERSARGAAWVLTALAASAMPVWLFRFTPEAYRAALVLAAVALLVPRPAAEIEDPWTMAPAHGWRAARSLGGGALLGLAVWELAGGGLALLLVPLVALPECMSRDRRRLVLGHGTLAALVAASVAIALHFAPLSRLRSLDPWREPATARLFTTELPRESGEDFTSLGVSRPRLHSGPSEPVSDQLRAYALRDELVGRFSGALWWYPCAALSLGVIVMRRPRPWRLALPALALVGLAVHALAHPAAMSGPSDGPGTAMSAAFYPLIVVAGIGVIGLRSFVVAWTMAGALLGEPLTNPLAAVREPALHARSFPYTVLPLDMSRIGHWPGGRTIGLASRDLVLVDARESIDVVTDPCDLAATDGAASSSCFWTPAKDAAEVLVWQRHAVPPPYVVLRAGPVATQATIHFGATRSRHRLAPGEVARVPIATAGEGFASRIDGRDGWAWVMRISSKRSFQPALAGSGRDRHWLGVQVAIPVAPG